MITYRNIDHLLMDSTSFISIGDRIVFSQDISIGDEVALKTDNLSMVIRVDEKLENKYRGTVLHDNSPRNIADWIQVGEKVEFSVKKISGKRV